MNYGIQHKRSDFGLLYATVSDKSLINRFKFRNDDGSDRWRLIKKKFYGANKPAKMILMSFYIE